MKHSYRQWTVRIGLVLTGVISVGACTNPDPDAGPPLAEQAGQDSPAASEEQNGSTDSSLENPAEAQTTSVAGGIDPVDASSPPASRATDNPSTNDVDHWIGRGLMTASSIELIWSPVDDVQSYRVHRFEQRGGMDPDVVALTEENLIYEGTAVTTVDEGLVEGTFYTYVIDVQIADGSLDRRWTEGLARDDNEPPAPITNLQATATEDGVLLTWDPSSDNVEFASYSVSLAGGDELQYIGGGADIEQSSFLDTRPPSGLVTYSVQAVDFHDNRTDPATIEFNNS